MSNISVNTITDASGGSTASINGLTPQASNMQPFNRIINGAMTIDQRNAGAAVTVSSNELYAVDRFVVVGQPDDGVFTAQQSSTAPAGFTKSLLITVTTADASIGASQFYLIQHRIEGFNTADLGFGTASAQTVALSFWVRSSLTGTFGGSLRNGSSARSYPFSYTISVANTWEYKTVIITGDTSGTWVTDNGQSINVTLSLGDGSSRLGTAGAWSASNFSGATGQTNLIGTSGATFYITGVQLEAGSTASSFAHENYSDTLQKCQRYLPAWRGVGQGWTGQCNGTTAAQLNIQFPVQTRTAPTGLFISSASHAGTTFSNGSISPLTAFTFNQASNLSANIVNLSISPASLVAGNATNMRSTNASFVLYFTGCEL